MATISAVLIGNMALSHVASKSRIESFDEKSSEAREIKLWYDYSRLQALEAYDWTFARKRASLALDGQDPPDEWKFRYQLPTNCVAPRRIWNPFGDDHDKIPYALETNDNDVATLLTDMEDAVLIFTADTTATTAYTPFFVETLSFLVAYHVAFALTGKREVEGDMLQAYQALIRSAPAYNANEESAKKPRDADWIRARGIGPHPSCRR